ncbi:hypothetical protein PAPHI01_1085 [Pancytospora philotis]|nr:hypothetical protein PAPHI01_1085 [Pancytospora philotis]
MPEGPSKEAVVAVEKPKPSHTKDGEPRPASSRQTKIQLPKFQYKTVKALHDPIKDLPVIEESTVQFYDFDSYAEDSKAGGLAPFIIYLDTTKVEEATAKERTQYYKDMRNIALKILLVLACILVGGYIIYASYLFLTKSK